MFRLTRACFVLTALAAPANAAVSTQVQQTDFSLFDTFALDNDTLFDFRYLILAGSTFQFRSTSNSPGAGGLYSITPFDSQRGTLTGVKVEVRSTQLQSAGSLIYREHDRGNIARLTADPRYTSSVFLNGAMLTSDTTKLDPPLPVCVANISEPIPTCVVGRSQQQSLDLNFDMDPSQFIDQPVFFDLRASISTLWQSEITDPVVAQYRNDFDWSGSLFVTYTFIEAGVPEPSSWITMIAGFGLLGGTVRRRCVRVRRRAQAGAAR